MKRSKHGLFVFPPKKTLIWRRHCSIGQSCCSMKSKRSIDWFLESSRAWSFFSPAFTYLNQPKATHVCIRSINQSNRSISVRLLFLLFARFHFKVIRKSLYQCLFSSLAVSKLFEVAREVTIYGFSVLNFFELTNVHGMPFSATVNWKESNHWYSNNFPERSPSQYRVLYRCLIIYRCLSDIMRKKVMFV